MGWLKNLFESKAQKATRKTNEILARIEPALEENIGQWRVIECGRYVNKPILSRVLRYIAGFENDTQVEYAVADRRLFLNNRRVMDAHRRLACGSYTVFIKGRGEYRFHIR